MDLKQPMLPMESKPRGLPLWTVLAALLLLAIVSVVALGLLFYFERSSKRKIELEAQSFTNQLKIAEMKGAQAAERAKVALAQGRQEEFVAKIKIATNTLETLLQKASSLDTESTSLRTNDIGRSVARFPDLVSQARRLYEAEIPGLSPLSETISRIESCRRIQLQLLSASGTVYEPESNLVATVQNAADWARQEDLKVSQVQGLVNSLVQESKIKVTSLAVNATSPTLEAAMNGLSVSEAKLKQKAVIDETAQAKTAANETLAAAEAKRIIEEAKVQADKIVNEAKDAAEKERRERAVKEAENKLADTKSQIAAQTAMDEAHKIELRKKASDPKVQAELAPFITPGYQQIRSVLPEKKPLSYTELKSCGALNPNVRGMGMLVRVASSGIDKDRPRWQMNSQLFARHPDQIEKVSSAQKLLIELGPVLVDMKLLEP